MSDEMSAEQVKSDFLNAMSYFAAGVTIVATDGPSGIAGQTVSAFTSISADPPSILVCLNLDSSGCIPTTENGVFSVNFWVASTPSSPTYFLVEPMSSRSIDSKLAIGSPDK